VRIRQSHVAIAPETLKVNVMVPLNNVSCIKNAKTEALEKEKRS
jgi:hypothetical protein